MEIDASLRSVILDAIALGVAVIDRDQRILVWNQWLVRYSGIPDDVAIGRTLTEVFPELADHRRLQDALDLALSHRLASIISPSIHRPPLPLYRDAAQREKQERLQQLIQITPIRMNGLAACTLQVQDVTAAVHREHLLRDQSAELAVHNQQLKAQLQEIRSLQAEIATKEAQDPLTGVLNRRHIDKHLKAMFHHHQIVSLVLVDADRLGRINEDHGFAAGDAVIQQLAQVIRNGLPNEACKVGRYESDAFLILLPGVEAAAARECILRCHERFISQPVMHEHQSLQAGFSAGIVEFPRDGQSENELIQCLDLTMFLTRHEGGNRILSYSDVRNNF